MRRFANTALAKAKVFILGLLSKNDTGNDRGRRGDSVTFQCLIDLFEYFALHAKLFCGKMFLLIIEKLGAQPFYGDVKANLINL